MKKFLLLSGLIAFVALFAACSDNKGEAEKMGEKLDRAAEEMNK